MPDVRCIYYNGRDYMYIGMNITKFIATHIVKKLAASRYLIVSDSNVASNYLEELVDCLKEVAGAGDMSTDAIITYVIPAGELSKTREIKTQIEDFALDRKCDRNTCFIAFGGGVIGDLVGFVASTYMRGVPVVQIPTTLLSVVDSSIGGKTGVNTMYGKNTIGLFHQPALIFGDLKYLRTLQKSEVVAAFGEIIKMAAVFSERNFRILERNSVNFLESIFNIGLTEELEEQIMDIIYDVASMKIEVVVLDEKERSGPRELLNFGHTFGHALEKGLEYLLPHGACVAIGCVYEAEISRDLGYMSDVAVGRLIRCIRKYGLPAYITDHTVPEDVSKIWREKIAKDLLGFAESMRFDKKSVASNLRMVLLYDIGRPVRQGAVVVPFESLVLALSPSVSISAGHRVNHHIKMKVPGSKSISNRALILASLGTGSCVLHGILRSDDVCYMIDGLEKILNHVNFFWENNALRVTKTSSNQISSSDTKVPCEVYVGNSGTAARFLTALVSICTTKEVTIKGNERMESRPIDDLVDALTTAGVSIKYLKTPGSLPIKIHSTESKAVNEFKADFFNIVASKSSQFVSALLMCAPSAERDVVINIISDRIVSQSYTDMTLAMMKFFGIKIQILDDHRRYRIKSGYYINPPNYKIEGDASSAAYPLSLAAASGFNITVMNVGYESLQGDADFAPNVLADMGARVTRSRHSTILLSPSSGCLKPLGVINMDRWTDSFLVTAAIAAIAPPTDGVESTRITGIENQRMKECNRINAIVTELSKFGVKVIEHTDGVEIFGTDKSNLHVPALPGCWSYDDHRIAISLSILSCLLKKQGSTVISHRNCVEKTWPGWWGVLSSEFNVKVEGYCQYNLECDKPPTKSLTINNEDALHLQQESNSKFPSIEWHLKYAHSFPPVKDFEGIKSIILIGFRASGKSYLGRKTSVITNLTFIDMDVYFSEKTGISISTYINENNWTKFRELEVIFLKEVLAANKINAIISCGGGIVCTEAGRAVLKEWINENKAVVIHIWRDLEKDIIPALSADQSRPKYQCTPLEEWKERELYYKSCSNYEFFNLNNEHLLFYKTPYAPQTPVMRLARLIHFSSTELGGTGKSCAYRLLSLKIPPTIYRSYFVSVKVKNVEMILPDLHEIVSGVAAIELRVDGLESYDKIFVSSQLALLKSYITLPIIFTIRSSEHSGNLPPSLKTLRNVMLELAIRQGCEIIDVEFDMELLQLSYVYNPPKSRSLILSSYHDTGDTLRVTSGDKCSPISDKLYEKLYRKQAESSDIVKIVLNCNSMADNLRLEAVKSENGSIRELMNTKPLISFTMGHLSPLSRIFNTFLSPVTHDKLPEKTAPGQLDVKSTNNMLYSLGIMTLKYFYLFGKPISKSPSPLIFNTAFRELGLPYEYRLYQTSDYGELKEFINSGVKDNTFGGASVTIPLKIKCVENNLCQKVSANVAVVGSLNTLYTDENSGSTILACDNTDCIGIESILRRYMLINNIDRSSDIIGVVIGAGGTSRAAIHALKCIGCSQVYVWNRTVCKAQSLASNFSVNCLHDLHEIGSTSHKSAIHLIVGTIPSHAQKQYSDVIHSFIRSIERGCLIEMAYGEVTELLSAVKDANGKWDYADGLTVLVEQASYQFKLFTRYLPFPSASREVIADRCDVSRREMLIPL